MADEVNPFIIVSSHKNMCDLNKHRAHHDERAEHSLNAFELINL